MNHLKKWKGRVMALERLLDLFPVADCPHRALTIEQLNAFCEAEEKRREEEEEAA